MSPLLFERLFAQIKKVFGKRVALADERGMIHRGFSDFGNIKSFQIAPFNQEKDVVPIEGEDSLLGIPIFQEGKFVVLVVAELPENDRKTAEIIRSLSELITEQFILQYRPKPDAVDLLVSRIVYKSSTIDHEELYHQLAALGYRLDVKRAALALELEGFQDHYLKELGLESSDKEGLIAAKKRDIDRALSNFFTKNTDNLVGFIGQDTFIVLKDLRGSDYEKFCGLLQRHFQAITSSLNNIHIKHVTVGVGTDSETPEGWLRSIREAIDVLEIGKKVAGTDKVHRFGNLGVLPLILTEAKHQKKEYAENLVSSLKDEQLLHTLEAFLSSDLSLTKTAERLGIHRNTVIYRLDRINEKIGKDPRKFNQAVEIYIGLLFDKALN